MFYPLQIHHLQRKVKIPVGREFIFNFFSDIRNLDRITPPALGFRVLSPLPVDMKQNEIIDLSIKLGGIRFPWKSEITEWEPPLRFVDRQVKGPFMVWIHEHRFEFEDGMTVMHDYVRYAVPGFIFEPLIHLGFVKKRLQRIFDYREEMVLKIFS